LGQKPTRSNDKTTHAEKKEGRYPDHIADFSLPREGITANS